MGLRYWLIHWPFENATCLTSGDLWCCVSPQPFHGHVSLSMMIDMCCVEKQWLNNCSFNANHNPQLSIYKSVQHTLIIRHMFQIVDRDTLWADINICLFLIVGSPSQTDSSYVQLSKKHSFLAAPVLMIKKQHIPKENPISVFVLVWGGHIIT